MVSSKPCPDALKSFFAVISIDDGGGGGVGANAANAVGGDKGANGSRSGGAEDDEVGALFGATKEVVRMSEALVEAAFDGDVAGVQKQLDKGFHLESCDEHEQTALSEAACKGHDAVVTLLLGKEEYEEEEYEYEYEEEGYEYEYEEEEYEEYEYEEEYEEEEYEKEE